MTVVELKGSAAWTLGVTIARRFTTSLANDHGDVGFFLGVSPIISSRNIQETAFHIVINAILMQWRKKCK